MSIAVMLCMNFIFPGGILHGLKCLTSKKETQNLSQMQRQHNITPVSILLSMERNQGKAEQLQLSGLKAKSSSVSVYIILKCSSAVRTDRKYVHLSHIQKAKHLPRTVHIYFIQASKYRVATNTQVNTLSVLPLLIFTISDQGTNPLI